MKLFDVVDREKWKKIQNGFSKALGFCIRTVDPEGNPIPGINEPNTFCLDIINQLPKGLKFEHEKCLSRLTSKSQKDKGIGYHIGPFGEYIYCIPVEIDSGVVLAYIVIGPLYLQKIKDADHYRDIAKRHNIPLDYLMDRLSGLKRFSFNNIDSIVGLLHEITHYVVQLSYDTKRIKEQFSGIPKKLDNVVKDIYSSMCFEELLNALLDVSLNTTKGSSGSIMLVGDGKDELSVKFSRGLDEDMVKKSRVKIGNGISGLVAKNRTPLLIDDSIKDSKIKNRLKRPYIASSIIYPLEARNQLLGVLNINNTNKKKRFSADTLELVDNLTRLAKIALTNFPIEHRNFGNALV